MHLPDSPKTLSPGDEEKHVDLPDIETHHTPALGVGHPMGMASKDDPKRFCMYFEKESKTEIERRKMAAMTTPITPVPEVYLYGNACFLSIQDMGRGQVVSVICK